MRKSNGRSEVEKSNLDLEHELPPGDDAEGPEQAVPGDSSAGGSELQKITAERDSLLDRLARAQAEFENARRRAVKEQQDYRDYAAADAIKSLLPAMDSLERALRVKADAADLLNGGAMI